MPRPPHTASALVSGAGLLVALSTVTVPASAVVIVEDPFEEKSLEVGGALRSYNFFLHGGPLDSPFVAPSEDPAGLAILAMRPKLELERPTFSLVVHDELTSTSSSLPTDQVGTALSIGQGASVPLFLPLQWTPVDRSTYQLRDRIDWIYARASLDRVSFTLGRQPVTIGRGQLWTPEDLLAPFSPLQLNTEFKQGIDAARIDWAISDDASMLLVGALGEREPDQDFEVDGDGSAVLARVELAFGTLRLGTLGGFVRGDVVGGLDLFVDLQHGADLHGSATVAYVPDEARRPYGRAVFSRAVLGTTVQPVSKLLVVAEAYFNGSGAQDSADYLDEFASPRFAVGEEYNVGRFYAGLAVEWEIHPLLTARASAIVNGADPSGILAPELDYNIAQNALIVAGAFVPIGSSPRYDAAGITPRTEYGSYPQVYHLDAKTYF